MLGASLYSPRLACRQHPTQTSRHQDASTSTLNLRQHCICMQPLGRKHGMPGSPRSADGQKGVVT